MLRMKLSSLASSCCNNLLSVQFSWSTKCTLNVLLKLQMDSIRRKCSPTSTMTEFGGRIAWPSFTFLFTNVCPKFNANRQENVERNRASRWLNVIMTDGWVGWCFLANIDCSTEDWFCVVFLSPRCFLFFGPLVANTQFLSNSIDAFMITRQHSKITSRQWWSCHPVFTVLRQIDLFCYDSSRWQHDVQWWSFLPTGTAILLHGYY